VGWLKAAYGNYQDSKMGRLIEIPWAELLADPVGISDAYARRLRVISRVSKGYPEVRKLDIPLIELYNLRKDISELFESNADNCVAYWQNA
jgi:hypothetical protein